MARGVRLSVLRLFWPEQQTESLDDVAKSMIAAVGERPGPQRRHYSVSGVRSQLQESSQV